MGDSFNNPTSASGPATAVSKAQQFEDEKRRIMQSCFHKQDTDGSLLESYITHCRVLEDSSSTSAPPSLDSPANNKKPRLIFVAVRKSGRVRMHKARENTNGTFSIGKTWNLDDLQVITNHDPPHEKGFTVTIQKPYYWQANSSKEKDFFISSLLKIYKKYTGGKIPELVGFGKAELEALLGPGGSELARKQRQEEGGKVDSEPNGPVMDRTSAATTQSVSSLGKESIKSAPRPPPGPAPVPALNKQKSVEKMAARRAEPPVQPSPPPQIPYGGAAPPGSQIPTPTPSARRPSDSSSRSGVPPSARSNSRPRMPDDHALRKAPSQERIRPSPAQNQEARREAMDQYPRPRPAPIEPPPVPRGGAVQIPPLNTKKSDKDVASKFRLAANTYNAVQSPNHRPRTPTTPVGPTSREPSRGPSENSLQRPGLDQRIPSNSSASTYAGRPSEDLRRPSADLRRPSEDLRRPSGDMRRPSVDNRRPSVDNRRPSVDNRRPSNDGGRPRSLSRSSREAPPAVPAALSIGLPPPLPKEVPKEPPPRSEMRGRMSFSLDSMDPATFLQNQDPEPQQRPRPAPRGSESSGQPTIAESPQSLTPVVMEPPRGRSRSPAVKERKRRPASSYLSGLDRSGLTVDIDSLLQEFNWDGNKKLEDLKKDVKKELGRVESSNVVINLDHDDRVEQLSELLDHAIRECEEMDGLLTLYAVELTSLNDDIFHIENQSQGLQVQTANEKTLQKELETLLSMISISDQQLDILNRGSLETSTGLEQIEQTLVAIYKALLTIDPDMTPTSLAKFVQGGLSVEGIGSMAALQERKDDYRTTVGGFMQRLNQFAQEKFQNEFRALSRNLKQVEYTNAVRPHLPGHEAAYHSFWRFSGIVAFAKDIDGDQYYEVQKLYERPAKHLFVEEFRDHILAWKKITRQPTQEEIDLVFTTPEKEYEHSAVSAARKLTVKKSIARIRGDSFSAREPMRQVGIIPTSEAFAGAFGEIFQLVFKEQNFIVEFFQLSSQAPADFLEFIGNGGTTPDSRRLGDLGGFKSVETDKVKAKAIWDFMNDIFSFLTAELQNLADWATSSEPVQGVGIMYTLEQKLSSLEETNQEFLTGLLTALHKRLEDGFARFLEEQVKAIEETKVKIKKRKGVVGFMRVFPLFAGKIESILPTTFETTPIPGKPIPVRHLVNEAYKTLNTSMFSSLRTIAKDSPTLSSLDPDDKSSLNYHIMMIENMHHYLTTVQPRQNPTLEDFLKKAQTEYSEHLLLYTQSVIRRPVGKLLDFVTHVEGLLEKGEQPEVSHQRSAFKKVLKDHDGKEIKRGIDQLRKRVEKHFEGAGEVTEKVEGVLEEEFIKLHKRVQLLLVKPPYKDTGLEVEFLVGDVRAGFKR